MVSVLSGGSFIGKCFLLESGLVWFGRRSSAAVGNVSFIGRDGLYLWRKYRLEDERYPASNICNDGFCIGVWEWVDIQKRLNQIELFQSKEAIV